MLSNTNNSRVAPIKNTPSIYNFQTSDLKYVQVFIEFLRIGEMDTMHEKYITEVQIESKWTVKNDMTKYDPIADWNPKSEFRINSTDFFIPQFNID